MMAKAKEQGPKAKGQGPKAKGQGPKAKGGAAKRVRVTLVRSPIGFNKTQGDTVTSMGLRKIRHTVELPDTPETRGMILKVRHLVEVSE
jgi:large subunit ribosomal protein L30